MNETTRTRPSGAPGAAASIFGHPIYPVLAAVPVVCFTGALITDIVYARSPQIQWSNFSAWLITAGLVFALFATIALVFDYLQNEHVRRNRTATIHLVLTLSAYLIELFNIFVHSRDAYTSVVPTGLTLSAIAVVLLFIGGWLGVDLPSRRVAGARA